MSSSGRMFCRCTRSQKLNMTTYYGNWPVTCSSTHLDNISAYILDNLQVIGYTWRCIQVFHHKILMKYSVTHGRPQGTCRSYQHSHTFVGIMHDCFLMYRDYLGMFFILFQHSRNCLRNIEVQNISYRLHVGTCIVSAQNGIYYHARGYSVP